MARAQAQQIVDQASEEATEIRMGAMYYTKDKLSEMRDICSKITELEKANYKTLIETMENHTYTIETNLDEMEANINMLTSSSGMSYVDDDQDLDSAFSNSNSDTQSQDAETAEKESSNDDEDDDFDEDDDLLDDNDDDFLEE
jgi:recombination DNA repair RAD52 pathway protein